LTPGSLGVVQPPSPAAKASTPFVCWEGLNKSRGAGKLNKEMGKEIRELNIGQLKKMIFCG
jgi:hypothetical protein